MFKVKIRVRVITGNTTRSGEFETMVDNSTWQKLSMSGSRDPILESWRGAFFPDADKIELMQQQKV